jgi:hypothetical protein
MAVSKDALALIDAFKAPIINYLKDIKDEVSFYFDTAIIEYVDKMRSKYIKTKTFLYRLENVNFYDVYFPIRINHNLNNRLVVEKIEDLFSNSNFVSIIGYAGSGKSMLLKHIFLICIKYVSKIPFVIELRNLNDYNGTLIEYITSLISSKKLTPNNKILSRILTKGDFLFLFDGYDEIYSENKNKLTSELIDFFETYNNNYFLITSRPGANLESLPQFENYCVNQLNSIQITDFIKLQLQHCDDKRLINRIIEVVNRNETNDYRSYLTSPLLLSMFILTFNSYPELPKSRSKFYWNVFDTLCTKHDAFTKYGGYQHERKSGLPNEDLETVLKWFAYISFFNGKYAFDNQYLSDTLKLIKSKLALQCQIQDLIDDLTISISIIMIDGLEYKFPHKSLQEYFAASLIKEQSEENKKFIYSEKLEQLEIRSFGGTESFYNLCLEMDRGCFIKYFIISNLSALLQNIDFSSDERICFSFLNYIKLRQKFYYNQSENTYIFDSYEWFNYLSISLLQNLELPGIDTVGLSHYRHKADQNIESLIQNKKIAFFDGVFGSQNGLDYSALWDDTVYDFVKAIGIDKSIINIANLVSQKVKDFSSELEIIEKNKNDLLSI